MKRCAELSYSKGQDVGDELSWSMARYTMHSTRVDRLGPLVTLDTVERIKKNKVQFCHVSTK
jgi:hypothetical protein